MQILKVVPYSAVQLYSYDFLKQRMTGRDKPLSVRDRMIAGACAGMIATLVHPDSPFTHIAIFQSS